MELTLVSFTELAPWIWCTARLEGIDEVIVWKKGPSRRVEAASVSTLSSIQ